MSHYGRFTGYKSVKRYGYTEGWRSHSKMGSSPGTIYDYQAPVPYQPWENDNLIYEGRLDEPILQSGNSIYIDTLKTSVNILKVERSTENIYTYLTDYVIEETEDESTQTTKEHAELRLKLAKENWDGYNEPRSEYQGYKPSWWQRLKDMFS